MAKPRGISRSLLASLICTIALFLWVNGCGRHTGGGGTVATFTGQVEGSAFSAVNNVTGVELRTAAVGSGNLKSFSLSVPVGATYRFFVIENEGTAFERPFPVLAGGSLADVFSVSEPIVVSMGFINTTMGTAVPAISAGGLAAAGVSPLAIANGVPPSFSNAFTGDDLVGVWNVHGLNVEGLWFHDTATMTNSVAVFSPFITNAGTINGTTIPLNILISGIINSPGSIAFNGAMGHLKDTIVASATSLVNAGGNQLLIAQKTKPGIYNVSDLSGSWQAQGAMSGLLFKGWTEGAITFDAFGNISSASLIRSDNAIINAPSGVASVSASGEITFSGEPTFHGAINTDKTVIAATMTDSQGDPFMLVFQKRTLPGTSGHTAADLAGVWYVHDMTLGNTPGWHYGQAFIDSSGNVTLDRVSLNNSDNSDTSFTIAVDSNGDLSSFQNFPGLIPGAGFAFLGPEDDLFALVFSYTRGVQTASTFVLMQK